MFETLEDLSRTLPRPQITGNPVRDGKARARYLANAHAMRSEAFACVGRAMVKAVKNGFRQLTTIGHAPRTHRA